MKCISKWMLAATIGFSMFSGVAMNEATTEVQASTKQFPKSFLHTWYQYSGYGQYSKITFYKGAKISYRECYEGSCYAAPKTRVKVDYYNNLWNVKGINQTAGTGTYYKVTTVYKNGKKYKALKQYSGAMQSYDGTYYLHKMR